MTTQFDEVLKGIYQFSGDELVLCMAKRDEEERPTTFSAPAGSGDLLFRLKMATVERVPASAPPVPRSAPKATDSGADKDQQIRQKIVGSWLLNDFQGSLTLVFRTDGTFVATRAWRSGLKRLFDGNTTTSEGRWSYSRGLLDAFVTSTMDPKLLSRTYNYWVQSVGDNTMSREKCLRRDPDGAAAALSQVEPDGYRPCSPRNESVNAMARPTPDCVRTAILRV